MSVEQRKNKKSGGFAGTIVLTIFFCFFASLLVNGFLNMNHVLRPSVFQRVDEQIVRTGQRTSTFASEFDFLRLTEVGTTPATRDAYRIMTTYFRAALNGNTSFAMPESTLNSLIDRYSLVADNWWYRHVTHLANNPDRLQISNISAFAEVANDIPFPIITVFALATIIPTILLLGLLVLLNLKRLKSLCTCLGVVFIVNGVAAFLWSFIFRAVLNEMQDDAFNIIFEGIAGNLIWLGIIQIIVGVGLFVLRKFLLSNKKAVSTAEVVA